MTKNQVDQCINLRLARPTRKRPCAACGMERPANGHDPCIANLPGVKFACCGHGVRDGYVYFENGIIIRGIFRIEIGENGRRVTLNPPPN
jgi:hypothetical protein